MLSEMMSGDKKPTIHDVISLLVNLQGYLEKVGLEHPASFGHDYCEILINELNRRFPDNGCTNELYAFGHILHPYYRGRLMRKGSERWKNR